MVQNAAHYGTTRRNTQSATPIKKPRVRENTGLFFHHDLPARRPADNRQATRY
jgi:hypothetical protein